MSTRRSSTESCSELQKKTGGSSTKGNVALEKSCLLHNPLCRGEEGTEEGTQAMAAAGCLGRLESCQLQLSSAGCGTGGSSCPVQLQHLPGCHCTASAPTLPKDPRSSQQSRLVYKPRHMASACPLPGEPRRPGSQGTEQQQDFASGTTSYHLLGSSQPKKAQNGMCCVWLGWS